MRKIKYFILGALLTVFLPALSKAQSDDDILLTVVPMLAALNRENQEWVPEIYDRLNQSISRVPYEEYLHVYDNPDFTDRNGSTTNRSALASYRFQRSIRLRKLDRELSLNSLSITGSRPIKAPKGLLASKALPAPFDYRFRPGEGQLSSGQSDGLVWIQIFWKNGTSSTCSGWVGAARTVVTAGHFVYDSNRGGYAENIKVLPKFDTIYYDTEIFSEWAISISVPIHYINTRSFAYDIATLGMDYPFFSSLSGGTNKWAYANSDQELYDRYKDDLFPISYGYPRDKHQGTIWHTTLPLIGTPSNLGLGNTPGLVSNSVAAPGQSGSLVTAGRFNFVQRKYLGIGVLTTLLTSGHTYLASIIGANDAFLGVNIRRNA